MILIRRNNKISYSIWLMPTLNEKDIFQLKINELARRYNGPFFKPHVTLLSSFFGEEKLLMKKARGLARKINSFKVHFLSPTYLNEFFRCIFVKVDFNNDLKTVRGIASKHFEYKDNNYIPHLSLLYGNFGEKLKKKIVRNINSFPSSFVVNHIYLAQNDEKQLKWRVIQEYKVGNK